MSCWVVPTIAAELWGIPVQQVMDGMKSGTIPSKTESGFTFVDVAPNSPVFRARGSDRNDPPPPTYTAVSMEELAVLTATEDRPQVENLQFDDPQVEGAQHDAHDEHDEHTIDLGDWREARDAAERRRRRPTAPVAA
jgi:hypothetical protein